MKKNDLKSYTLEELEQVMADIGEKKFRAKQIYSWLHKNLVDNIEDMTDLSKNLRKKLSENFILSNAHVLEKLNSDKDNTTKYLFEIDNNNIIESVLMKYSYGNAVCVSSQAGCKMGCKFCASTIEGLICNLLPGEMLSQIYNIQKDINERVSNVVIMGSGEPLDNFENTIKFIKILSSENGLCIGQRHITLSTCGIVDKIYELSELNMQITLAISLHAPNDNIRKSIMPIANKYPIEDIIKAAKYYGDKTKRRVTFEYALIENLNDSVENARQLAYKLKGLLCHVNLIPINDVKERNYIKSSNDKIKKFSEVLTSFNIETTIRRKLGSDINAACGQLRRGYKKQ